MQVVFEDCSETDARRVSVFEAIKLQQEIVNLKASLKAAKYEASANWKLYMNVSGYNDEDQADLFRLRQMEARKELGLDPKPLIFWRAAGLIFLGIAFGASFVLFGLPKAHAQDYQGNIIVQWQAPLTPPNDLLQGQPQSFLVVPDGTSQGNGLGQLEGQSGVITDSGTGAVLGTYQVTP